MDTYNVGRHQVAELTALLPGVRLVAWDDLPAAFAAVPREERPARLARALAAAIVVPDKLGRPPRRWIGRAAMTEAEAFRAAGKPISVYLAGDLIDWNDLVVRQNVPVHPKFLPFEVIAPGTGQASEAAA